MPPFRASSLRRKALAVCVLLFSLSAGLFVEPKATDKQNGGVSNEPQIRPSSGREAPSAGGKADRGSEVASSKASVAASSKASPAKKPKPQGPSQTVYGETASRGRPLQIISPNELHTGFVVNEDALAALEKIPGPVSVVAVMGPIHSGKSFFLNSVLRAAEADAASATSGAAAPSRAFPVGYSVAPGSLGLSFWSEPLLVDRASGTVVTDSRRATEEGIAKVLLLDSEGFGGPNVTRSYDQLLYAVGSLLSSHVVFTSMKMIDAQALQLLEDLTRDANLFSLRAYARALRDGQGEPTPSPLLQTSSGVPREEGRASPAKKNSSARKEAKNATEETQLRTQAASVAAAQSSSALLSLLSPCCLWWVVQDFSQDLGRLSAQEWFERLLKTTRWLTPISALNSDSSDTTQHSLHSLYSSVKCVALGAPTQETSLFQRLDKLTDSQVDPDYAKAFAAVRRDLLRQAAEKPKMKLGAARQPPSEEAPSTQVFMSGRDIAELVRFLAAAANANMFDDVQIFMNHFTTSAMAKNDLLLLFERDLQQQQRAQTTPLLPSEVTAAAAALRDKTLALWHQQTNGEVYVQRSQVQQQEAQLEEKLQQITAKAVANANRLVGSFCEAAAAVQLSVQRESIQRKAKTLPVAPSELGAFSSNLQQRGRAELLRRLQTAERNYAETEACKKAMDAHFEAVQSLHLELISQNLEKITERIQKAAEAALLLLQRQVQQQQVDLLRPLSEYRGLLLDWQQSAWTTFETEVSSVKEVGDLYDEAVASLSERIRKNADKAVAEWEAKCRDNAAEVVARWKGLFRPQVVGALETPLPVEEAALAQALKEAKAAAVRDLERLYCSQENPWKEVAVEFGKELDAMSNALETENLEAIRVVCKQPLDNLQQELKATAETFYFWESFSRKAREMGEEVILASSDAVVSKSLARKAAEHWAEGELARLYKPLIAARLWGLFRLAGGLFVSVLGVLLAFKVSTNFFWMAALGAVLAFGLQAVVGALRTAFEEVVIGLLQYLYTRLGLEMVVVGVFFTISVVAVYLYSRFFAEAEKRAAIVQETVPVSMTNSFPRTSAASAAVPPGMRYSQTFGYPSQHRPTSVSGVNFGREAADFQSTVKPRASEAPWL